MSPRNPATAFPSADGLSVQKKSSRQPLVPAQPEPPHQSTPAPATQSEPLQNLSLSHVSSLRLSRTLSRPLRLNPLRRLLPKPEGIRAPIRVPRTGETLKPAFLQHPRRHQLLLNMPLQNLDQKLSQVRAHRLRPWDLDKAFHGSAKHLCRQRPRLARNLRRGQPLILRTHQSIRQGVKISAAPVHAAAADNALRQLRQKSNQPRKP